MRWYKVALIGVATWFISGKLYTLWLHGSIDNVNHRQAASESATVGREEKSGLLLSGGISTGKEVTQMLLDNSQWPSASADRMKFRPGTLDLNSTEAFRHCYVDPQKYRRHFLNRGGRIGLEVSDKYKMIYIMLAKSGSSTGKVVMKTVFAPAYEVSDTAESLESKEKWRDYLKVTFVRDPLSRFFSSYEEMFVRAAPFASESAKTGHLPKEFKWIFDGIHTYKDYEKIYCPADAWPKSLHNTRFCNQAPSKENGTLVRIFERFVRQWDGFWPFDVHLKLQSPLLSDERTGHPFKIDNLYDTHHATEGWRALATDKGITFPKTIEKARGYPRRMNITRVSVESMHKICQIAAIDNCCFNLPLAKVCAENDAAGVFCAAQRQPDGAIRVSAWDTLPIDSK